MRRTATDRQVRLMAGARRQRRRRGAVVGAGEPVRVGLSPAGVPLEFIWRGQRHRVRAVDGWRAATPRRAAAVTVRTDCGLRCTLSHDARDGLWRLSGVWRPGAAG